MTPAQVLELVLVGAGALAHLHIALSRSNSARALWFHPALYAWALSWTAWYASLFCTLNLEAISYTRFPWVSMAGDLAKGFLLTAQCGFLLHGISGWTGSASRVPAWAWYLAPGTILGVGAFGVAGHPMRDFLLNVEPVVRAFVALDLASCALSAWMLARALPGMDGSRRSVALPFLAATLAMLPLLGTSLWIKARLGLSGAARYDWVLLHELAHLLPPFALLWASYKTESVALEASRSFWRKARGFGAAFAAYLGLKAAFPLSEADRFASFAMAGLGMVGTLGPLVSPFGRFLSLWMGWGLPAESALLSRLEARLWNPAIPDERILPLCARGIGRILRCRCRVVPASDRGVDRILASRSGRRGAHAMFQATSRSEIQAWADLQARVLVPVGDPPGGKALVLGASDRADRLPDPVLERLEALGTTCGRILESRRRLRQGLEEQRRAQESERLAMLGLLAAAAAHEIKNPLSAIRNVATAALREASAGSTLRQDLSVVVGEVDRLDATVRRMLHFARDRDSCEDAAATVQSVAGLLSAEARERGLRLQVEAPRGPQPVPMSENDFKAILFNLIQNALRHAPAGSEVAVRLLPAGPLLEVENPGEIPEEMRAKLFRPLAPGTGTGLGLYISRSKAQAWGAALEHGTESGRTVFRLRWHATPTANGDAAKEGTHA